MKFQYYPVILYYGWLQWKQPKTIVKSPRISKENLFFFKVTIISIHGFKKSGSQPITGGFLHQGHPTPRDDNPPNAMESKVSNHRGTEPMWSLPFVTRKRLPRSSASGPKNPHGGTRDPWGVEGIKGWWILPMGKTHRFYPLFWCGGGWGG